MYKTNTNYLFTAETVFGFINIPEGTIALCTESTDEWTSFNVEGQTLVIANSALSGNIEEVGETSVDKIAMASAIVAEGFSEAFINSFCETAGATRKEGEKALRHWIAELICDANKTLDKSISVPQKELFFRAPKVEELAECKHNIPTLVIEDEQGTAYYLQAFRAYRFQISNTINGEGDAGSSPVCDLPLLADMNDPHSVLLPHIQWAVQEWIDRFAPGCYIRMGYFGNEYGPDEYLVTAKWFRDTVEYLRTRKMGGFKR